MGKYKLDRFDGRRMIEALRLMEKVRDYNYTSESDPLYRKLDTICRKMENLLDTELEPGALDYYKRHRAL